MIASAGSAWHRPGRRGMLDVQHADTIITTMPTFAMTRRIRRVTTFMAPAKSARPAAMRMRRIRRCSRADRFAIREAWSAIVAVGLRPCSGALMVLSFALAERPLSRRHPVGLRHVDRHRHHGLDPGDAGRHRQGFRHARYASKRAASSRPRLEQHRDRRRPARDYLGTGLAGRRAAGLRQLCVRQDVRRFRKPAPFPTPGEVNVRRAWSRHTDTVDEFRHA